MRWGDREEEGSRPEERGGGGWKEEIRGRIHMYMYI